MPKWIIKLACGHERSVFYPNARDKTGYFCSTCLTAQARDVTVEAKRDRS